MTDDRREPLRPSPTGAHYQRQAPPRPRPPQRDSGYRGTRRERRERDRLRERDRRERRIVEMERDLGIGLPLAIEARWLDAAVTVRADALACCSTPIEHDADRRVGDRVACPHHGATRVVGVGVTTIRLEDE